MRTAKRLNRGHWCISQEAEKKRLVKTGDKEVGRELGMCPVTESIGF